MADAVDLLTLDEAKAALNITTIQFDAEVAAYVTAVSQRLDDLCGPIVYRTVTDEVHSGGAAFFWPRLQPVASVSAVTEYQSGVATVLTAETATASGDYLLQNPGTHNTMVARRSGWGNRLFSAGTVMVTYVAGRFATTAAVSPKFKQAAAKMLVWLWRGDQGAGSATFGAADGTPLFGLGFALPNAVKEMLAEERRPPVLA